MIDIIKSIKKIEPRESYELEVLGNHNFYANDFLKHNCKLIKHNDKIFIFTNGMYLSATNRGAPVESSIHPEYNFKDISDVYLYCLGANDFDEDGSVIWKSEPNWIKSIGNGDTVMFELESPWNIIHTRLIDEPKLWIIGYRKADGQELNVWKSVEQIPFDRPKVYDFNSSEQLLTELSKWTVEENGEGIVVLYIDEQNNFHRVKIKCEDYLRVKYMEECSNIGDGSLFKLLMSGEADDLVAVQPELNPRIELMRSKVLDFKAKAYEVEKEIKSLNIPNRKDIVEWVKTNHHNHFSMYLACLDSADRFIERKFNSWKTNKNGYDELCSLL